MILNVTAKIKCDEPGCEATGEYELDFSGSAYYTRNEALHHLGWTFVEAEYSGDDDQDYCPEHSRQEENRESQRGGEMNIQEALKQTIARVTYGMRWLEINTDGVFFVYERRRAGSKSTLIIRTDDEEQAVEALLELAEEEK